MAVATPSRDAALVLTAAGLVDRFPVVVDGLVVAAAHLCGNPAPDTFPTAAQRLGVSPDETVVIEGDESGVAAGSPADSRR